jgi:hypothetical protein
MVVLLCGFEDEQQFLNGYNRQIDADNGNDMWW